MAFLLQEILWARTRLARGYVAAWSVEWSWLELDTWSCCWNNVCQRLGRQSLLSCLIGWLRSDTYLYTISLRTMTQQHSLCPCQVWLQTVMVVWHQEKAKWRVFTHACCGLWTIRIFLNSGCARQLANTSWQQICMTAIEDGGFLKRMDPLFASLQPPASRTSRKLRL